MENYTAGGLDMICREIFMNIDSKKIYLVLNRNIDEKILKTYSLPSKIKVIKYGIITPFDLSLFALKYKEIHIVYILLKFTSYIFRYPLLIIAFFYFYFFFKKIKYDVFITHNGGYPAALYCGIAALVSAIIKRRKSFFVFHSMPRKYSLAYFGFDYIWDLIIDKVCMIVAVSKRSALELNKVRNIKQVPFVIYNGIEPRERKLNVAFKELKVIHIGYVTDLKNQLMMLKTLDILINQMNLRVKVFFLGDFVDLYYKNLLEKFLVDNQLTEYAFFEGFKINIDSYFQNCHVLVSTSKVESFPVSNLEAMRIGMPVIATDVGGIKEQIIDNFDGFVVNCDDCFMLANKIRYLFDPVLFETLSVNAFNSFQNKFSKNKMIDNYNEMLYKRSFN